MRVDKEAAIKIEEYVLETLCVEEWGEQGPVTLTDIVEGTEEEPVDVKVVLVEMSRKGLIVLYQFRNRPWLIERTCE